jgi:hypothetical protein
VVERDADGHSRVVVSGGRVVAPNEEDVRSLVAHRGEVYWIAGKLNVRRSRGHSGVVETVASAARLDPRFLAVDDAAFYVVRGSSLMRLSRAGDAPQTLAEPSSPFRDLVLSGEWLYWTAQGESRLYCNADGSAPLCQARERDIVHPAGSLQRLRVVPPYDYQTLAGDLEEADGLLVARSFAYVSTRRGVVRVPLVAGGSPTVLPTRTAAFGRPVLDTVSWTLFVQTRPEGSEGSGAVIAALVP